MSSLTSTATPHAPTGSWRHPKMEEVARRQAQNSFTDASFLKVTYNFVALVLSYILLGLFSKNQTALHIFSRLPATISSNAPHALFAVRALFLWNIASELKILLRPADDCADVALTREQRGLLGLNPDTPLKAKDVSFYTPPRYTKSAPGSRTATPLPQTTISSPVMLRKGVLNGQGSSRGLADLQSPLSSAPKVESFGSLWSSLNSSPKGVGASSVVPSNRWAYEKSIVTGRKPDNGRISPSKNLFGSPR